MGEGDLPLSPDLKRRVRRWLAAYTDYEILPGEGRWQPTPPDVPPEEKERQWVAEGQHLRDAIQDELGSEYDVVYET